MDNCEVCNQIKTIKESPYFMAEIETGYVCLGWHQYFKGYTIFICKQHKTELHFLEKEFKKKFLYEMSLVAEAVYKAFKPKKLNYDLLGNGYPHMHWHIIPRYEKDLIDKNVVYLHKPDAFSNDKYRPSAKELGILKSKLKKELDYIIKKDCNR